MAKTLELDAPFKKGDKVRATASLRNVPEGTAGKVKLVNGVKWTRYWVFFDNGVDLGSIDQKYLVRTAHWEQFVARREAQANAPTTAAATSGAATGATPAADGAASGVASRIPEHLLERTRNRRKALGLS